MSLHYSLYNLTSFTLIFHVCHTNVVCITPFKYAPSNKKENYTMLLHLESIMHDAYEMLSSPAISHLISSSLFLLTFHYSFPLTVVMSHIGNTTQHETPEKQKNRKFFSFISPQFKGHFIQKI